MRVLHINCNYLSSQLHETEIEYMNKADIESIVFVPTYFGNSDHVNMSNVNVVQCFNKNDRIIFDLKQAKIFSAINRKIAVESYDCIHAYTLFTDGNVARKLNKKNNVPYVVAVRNTDVSIFFKKMFFLRKRGIGIMKDAEAIFFLSPAYKEIVLNEYVPEKYRKMINDKSFIIPNGIDPYWFENRYYRDNKEQSNNDINLIYAGRINANKNIKIALPVVKSLRNKGYSVRLIVAGKNQDQKIYDSLLQAEHVTVYPELPKEELIKLYRMSDIFIMPSFTETFGLVYVEAMSQGLPIIYTRGQGFDKQFPSGVVGYDVDPNDVNEIVSCIEKIIKNYNSISKNCSENIDVYSWDRIVTLYKNKYEEIIEH